MDTLTPLVLLKGSLLMLPSLGYFVLTTLAWKSRIFGPTGRARYGAVGWLLAIAVGAAGLGGYLGSTAYGLGPGRGCRELGCLAVIGWIAVGVLVGLPLGIAIGWKTRKLAPRHAFAFFTPAAVSVLASAAALLLDGDMLR